MDSVSWILSIPKKHAILKVVADLHCGSINSNIPKFLNLIKWIKDTPDVYAMFLGDLADSITTSDKRFDIEATDPSLNTPHKQLNFIIKSLTPIKGKILGMCEGNHEAKLRVNSGINIIKGVCDALDTRYLGYSFMMNIGFKGLEKEKVKIYGHHGSVTGNDFLSCAKGFMNKVAPYFEADVYTCGHCHHKGAFPVKKFYLEGKEIKSKEIWWTITGSYLETFGLHSTISSYSEIKQYPPTATGSVSIKLTPSQNGIKIFCN